MAAGGKRDFRWVRAGVALRSRSGLNQGFVASIDWSNRSELEWPERSVSANIQLNIRQSISKKKASIQHRGAEIAEITE